MSEKDTIKDLFSDKLNGLESEVRPELWGNISSQLGNASAASGLSMLTKIVLGVTAAASLAVVSYFVLNNQNVTQKPAAAKEKTPTEGTVNETKTSSENQQTAQGGALTPTPEFLQETHEGSGSITFDPETPQTIHDQVEPVPVDDYQPEGFVEEQRIVTSESNANTESIIEEALLERSSALEIILPNTFTPNGDGVNETLQLNISEDKLTAGTFSFVVIDRTGKTVYQTTDVHFQWEGISMNGEVVPTGDYVYYVTARDVDGKLITKYSTLHIAR